MKTLKIIIILLLLNSLFIISKAQNTLWLLNGKKIAIGDYQINKGYEDEKILTYLCFKGKTKEIELESVLMIINSEGRENIFYKQDSLLENYFTIKQMQSYVSGENSAINNYKPWWSTTTGFVIGASSSFLTPLNKLIFINNFNIYYAPAFPIAYSIGSGICKRPSTLKISIENPKYADDIYFMMGYKSVAKQKRVKNSLIGGGLGIMTGIITAIIISN